MVGRASVISATVRTTSLARASRLDAYYFLSPGVQAQERLSLLKKAGVRSRPLGGPEGLGRVSPGSRTKRVYAAQGETAIPYLRPYDVFDYFPVAADYLSATAGSTSLKVVPGTILQTCSGRNLGPLAYADMYLSRFAISDDMLRVNIDVPETRTYVLAYLSTPTGQALLRRNKTGAVIDHLSPKDLATVEVLFPSDVMTSHISSRMAEAIDLRERARVGLDKAIRSFESSLPSPKRTVALRQGWTQRSTSLSSRIDAAYYDPLVMRVRHQLLKMGGRACEVSAHVFVPPRYNRYYVDSDHGRPVLSGRQLVQAKLINLRYISDRSIDPSEYEMREGWLAFGMEGRAEERIAVPALVTRDREGWLASDSTFALLRLAGRRDYFPGGGPA
jgi:hypothetical protein